MLNGLSLALAPQDCLLVLGPNGAGKSTLLRLLAGLIRPHAGWVSVAGRQVAADDPASRAPLGLVAHQTMLYDDLTLRENLNFAAQLYGLADAGAAVSQALDEAGLSRREHDRPRDLSRGMQQRAAIARALLHRPRVLLLDEAFTGLDAASADRLRTRLSEERTRGAALVVVSHHPGEAWELATHVGLLADGRWARLEPRPAELSVAEGWLREAARG
ncbi:MAG TPA: ABC transporter ATP-binding protein [Gemmatimonadales bacterium]|nr:ABC transporter ATP-binding protein [Gemmatimonadales bacterium]